jgi:DNA-binding LytR/AlgR family response regulator
MRVLIIEDEIKAAKALKKLIEDLDDQVVVVSTLSSVKAAIKWFHENDPPDLILSDIQLADGLSFDIYRTITVKSPVIFCTAFNEYAIQAFEINSIDYLLKPVDELKLKASLQKYKSFKQLFTPLPEGYEKKLARVGGQLDNQFKRSILVYYRDQIIPVKTTDICFIYAANGLVSFYTKQDKQYATQHTMEQLEHLLDPVQFFRVNRQFIINREIIQSVEHYFNRRIFIKINCESPEKIITSRIKSADFLHWMEI